MALACFDLLDRHVVGGRADEEALRSGSTGWSYARLLEEVSAFGGVLRHCGVREGDRVVVALPESVEAVVAVLACARIGAAHRLADATTLPTVLAEPPPATVLVTAGSEAYVADLLDRSERVPAVVLVKQRPGAEVALREGRDYDWDVVLRAGRTDPAAGVEGAILVTDDDRVRDWAERLLAGGTVRLDA